MVGLPKSFDLLVRIVHNIVMSYEESCSVSSDIDQGEIFNREAKVYKLNAVSKEACRLLCERLSWDVTCMQLKLMRGGTERHCLGQTGEFTQGPSTAYNGL